MADDHRLFGTRGSQDRVNVRAHLRGTGSQGVRGAMTVGYGEGGPTVVTQLGTQFLEIAGTCARAVDQNHRPRALLRGAGAPIILPVAARAQAGENRQGAVVILQLSLLVFGLVVLHDAPRRVFRERGLLRCAVGKHVRADIVPRLG